MKCGKEGKPDSVSKHLSMGEKNRVPTTILCVCFSLSYSYTFYFAFSFVLFFLLLSLFHILSRDFLFDLLRCRAL